MSDQAGPPDQADAPYQANPVASSSRRLGWLIGIVVVVLAVLGGGALAVAKWWPAASVNPAERLPESVGSYFEVNLDPSFDQTPKLVSLINKFDLDETFEGIEDVITELLDQLDLDDVDVSEDLESWIGTRFALSEWYGDDIPYYVLALASTDDEAAEAGLAKLLDASDVEFGYVVDDELAVVVIDLLGEGDAQERADEVAAEGREAPLASSSEFVEALEWLDGDQLVIGWGNIVAQDVSMDAFMQDELLGLGPFTDMMFEAYEDMYSGINEMWGDAMIMGIRASDEGLDLTYKAFGGTTGPGNANWIEQLGDSPDSQVAALVTLPDNLEDLFGPFVDMFAGGFAGQPIDGLDEFNRGLWEYDLAMTEDELAEYDDLYGRWDADHLAEGDPEFDRLVELEDQFWLFGLQSDYDDAIAAGTSEEEWRLEQALTPEEHLEFVELNDLADQESLPTEDEEYFYELDIRLYRHGLVTDYDIYVDEDDVDVAAIATDVLGLLSGAEFTAAVGDVFADEPDFTVTVDLGESAADELAELPWWDEFADALAAELGDALTIDGGTLALGEGSADGGTLTENERFAAAFADAPGEASMAFFVDVAAIIDDAPDDVEWLEPLAAVSFVHDNTDSSGTLRVLID